MRSILELASPQFTVALLIKVVALMLSTVTVMTEASLDELFDVRLNTKVTPGLLSLKMYPSGSADVNRRVTLAPKDESSKSILHSKRVKEP